MHSIAYYTIRRNAINLLMNYRHCILNNCKYIAEVNISGTLHVFLHTLQLEVVQDNWTTLWTAECMEKKKPKQEYS